MNQSAKVRSNGDIQDEVMSDTGCPFLLHYLACTLSNDMDVDSLVI
jgi:hypothetical protein